MKIDLSIIIVNYRVRDELIECLRSICGQKSKIKFEVIVVDNSGELIASDVKKIFKNVTFLVAKRNLGFGGGNNIGAKKALGKYLFFLNPDTIVLLHALDRLFEFIEKNSNVGIVAPLLLDPNKKPYPLQGTKKLTPIRAIFGLSFIDKLFPKNPISSAYWMLGRNKKKEEEVYVMPGTAFVISKALFDRIHGFDKKFFLYFEENDLANRIRALGLKIIINPEAKVIHKWGASTKKRDDANEIFIKSRNYYFEKYYGRLASFLLSIFFGINKYTLSVLLIILMALFLRLYRLSELMIFIPDQAWFYISARNMLLGGQIPLVGIISSQTWLHQGPLWTYMLAVVLWLFKFNPISGAYLSILFDLVTIFVLYLLGKEFFSKQTGLIAAFLYAASPLAIILSRMPYHTSPIPFFASLLLFFTVRWVRGNVTYFPFVLFLLSLLYNFELATVVVWFAVLLILIYGFWAKKIWAVKIFKPNIITFALIAFIIPLIPIILYDTSHGFVQTLKYANWVISLKIIKPLITLKFGQGTNFGAMHSFLHETFRRLIFLPSASVAAFLFAASLVVLLIDIVKAKLKSADANILFLLFIVPFAGFVFNGVASDAYMPLLFPSIILMLAYLVDKALQRAKPVAIAGLLIVVLSNMYLLLSNSYYIGQGKLYGPSFTQRVMMVNKKQGNMKNASYEYLLWWSKYPNK